MNKGLLIFDMDGTLIDSSIDITISVNYVRKSFGLPPLSVDNVVSIINGKREELPYNLYHVETYTPEHRRIFEAHYIEQCTKNTYVYDGVKEALHRLISSGYQLAVATNAYTKFAERMLAHLNIDNFFNLIVGACKVKNPKPSPDMIHHIVKQVENVERVVMIGDNHTDVYAAKNANIEMVFANWGFGEVTDYSDVHFIAKHPLEIIDYLN
ncbi:MAG: HAD-IA family hydrolase [Calditerrivibrio sp.]|nr:HAD-IA family hydrolase [Calditerrivibrio sp.]MCA1932208.1 HAD-IA family hydrolase [Calditerrivibrio sp.]